MSLTTILCVGFCIPAGSGKGAATVYVAMEGKTLTLQDAASKPVEITPPTIIMPVKPPPVATPLPPRPKKLRGKKSGQRPYQKVAIASAPVISTQPVVTRVAIPPPPAPAPEYTLDSVAERYEGDPSTYSLDRSAKGGGVTLRLLGLERLAGAYVLKLSVSNESDSDLYVKDFIAQAGTTSLVSRFFFRILVESQRTREGYVMFEKPQSGAAVQIKLKEEGGKGRVFVAQIPYSF